MIKPHSFSVVTVYRIINATDDYLEIEKIEGTLLSTVYSNKELSYEHIDLLMNTLNDLHSVEVANQNNINIYKNYSKKLINRYENYNFSHFKNSHS